MSSRIKRANTGQWVSLCSDLARNPKTTKNAFIISYKPERVTTNTQAVLRLAWGLAKGNQSCNKPKRNTDRQAWGEGLGPPGPGPPGPWGRGLQGLVAGPPGLWGRAFRGLGPACRGTFRRSEKVSWWEAGEGVGGRWGPGAKRARDTPLPPPPAFLGCREKRRRFSPSPLLKPSNTPPKVGGLLGSLLGLIRTNLGLVG